MTPIRPATTAGLLAAVAIASACGSPAAGRPAAAAPAATTVTGSARAATSARPSVAAQPSAARCLPADLAPVPSLATVQFVSATMGWAAGAGRIIATRDGGRTWRSQYTGSAQLDQVDFTDAEHGWAVGTSALLATTDGGAHWTRLADPGPIRQVHFVTPALGYAVAGGCGVLGGVDVRLAGGIPAPAIGGVVLRTVDGGLSWHPVRHAPVNAQNVCFSSPSDGYLGTPGRIWHSTDGGRDWLLSFTEPPATSGSGPADSTQVECAGSRAAWVLFLGSGAAMNHAPYLGYATHDGSHWQVLFEQIFTEAPVRPEVRAPEGPGTYPGPFSAISPDEAVFLGSIPPVGDGVALMDLVTGTTLTSRGDVPGMNSACAVAFVSATRGWVIGGTIVGGAFVIEGTADGGRTWTRQYEVR